MRGAGSDARRRATRGPTRFGEREVSRPLRCVTVHRRTRRFALGEAHRDTLESMPRIYVPKVDTWAKAPQEPDAEFEEARREPRRWAARDAAVVELLARACRCRTRRARRAARHGRRRERRPPRVLRRPPRRLGRAPSRGDGYSSAREDVSVIGADDPERVEYRWARTTPTTTRARTWSRRAAAARSA